MISYVIDLVLVAALAVVAWRTGAMVRELRVLRSESSAFNRFLAESDQSINKAAEAVVMLRSEGIDTLKGLEARIAEARELADWLHEAIDVAETRAAAAAAACAAPAVTALRPDALRAERRDLAGAELGIRPERSFARRIESRLAPATAVNG